MASFCACYRQKQDDEVESIAAGILDLDWYAEHTADVTATSHMDDDGDEDDEHRLPAAESSHQPLPHQPPSTADDV